MQKIWKFTYNKTQWSRIEFLKTTKKSNLAKTSHWCNYYSRIFKNKTLPIRHQRIHTEMKPNQFNQYNIFCSQIDFTIHQRSHSSMNLYPWNPCGSCIIKKLILSITREHTICNHCDKNYIPKLRLNKKLRIHIVENS